MSHPCYNVDSLHENRIRGLQLLVELVVARLLCVLWLVKVPGLGRVYIPVNCYLILNTVIGNLKNSLKNNDKVTYSIIFGNHPTHTHTTL